MLQERDVEVPRLKFGHGVTYTWESSKVCEEPLTLLASYHPSRQNTQTGRLTLEMFDDIFRRVRSLLY
jgi:uracil-DNA glycosylase